MFEETVKELEAPYLELDDLEPLEMKLDFLCGF